MDKILAASRRMTEKVCDRDCMTVNACNGFKPCQQCGTPCCPQLSLNENGICDSCQIENKRTNK